MSSADNYLSKALERIWQVVSDGGDAELLVYLVDEEEDIYIGVIVTVCHLEPVGRVLSATSVQLNLYE